LIANWKSEYHRLYVYHINQSIYLFNNLSIVDVITKLLKIAGLMIDHMPLRKINPLHTDVDVIKQTAMFRNKMMTTDSSSSNSNSSSNNSSEALPENGTINSYSTATTALYSSSWKSSCCESLAVSVYYSALCFILKIRRPIHVSALL